MTKSCFWNQSEETNQHTSISVEKCQSWPHLSSLCMVFCLQRVSQSSTLLFLRMLLTAWSWIQLLCLLFVLSTPRTWLICHTVPRCLPMPLEAQQGKLAVMCSRDPFKCLRGKWVPELTQTPWCLSNTHWPQPISRPWMVRLYCVHSSKHKYQPRSRGFTQNLLSATLHGTVLMLEHNLEQWIMKLKKNYYFLTRLGKLDLTDYYTLYKLAGGSKFKQTCV